MATNFLKVKNGLTLNPQSLPSNPASGDIYYDSTANTYVFYNNGQWVNLSSRTDVASASSLTSSQLTSTIVQNSLIRITGSTSSTLYGLAASTGGKSVVIYNQSSATLLVNNNDSTEPTPANRILTYNSGTATVLAGQVIQLVYDDSQSRWILASSPGTGNGGSGVGDDLDALTFRASFTELFSDGPSSTTTSVNASAGFTNAAYNAAKTMWAINYDASQTIAGGSTTTNILLSGTPSFTVAIGDMVIVGGSAVKITAVTSQTNLTVEALSSAPSTGAQVTVSQAVHTKDIFNLAVDGSALSAAFPGTTMSEFLVDYKDNNVAGSNVFTPDVGPYVGFTASADNSSWSSVQIRPTLDTATISSTVTPTSGSSAYLRFFANESSGSGTVNLIMYKEFMQKLTSAGVGGISWSAYGTTNNSTTAVNCTIGTSGGKTTITLTNGNQYAVGVNSGQTFGSVDVYLNGQLLPRYVAGSVPSTDSYYTEVSGNVIQLDKDYSGSQLDVQVVQRSQTVDTSTTNTTNISSLQEINQNGFQGFINTNTLMTPTTTAGTPSSGTFYSSIPNRASIIDLTQDLKARMGVERIMTQQLSQVQNEFGPNGEMIWAASNDTFGQIRFIGSGWANATLGNDTGPYVTTANVGDYLEITFYGTGLNLLTNTNNFARTYTASVDGGAAGANFMIQGSSVIDARLYGVNQIVNVISGLTAGVHTVKITLGSGAALNVYGLEVLNESASVKVNPGIGYANGKKIATGSQSSFSYSAAVSGTKGGRVLVYQGSDGTIGQAFKAVNASAAYLTSSDHTNEEVARTYYWREFGAGRSDDFSGNFSNPSNLGFTLDDGTTSLNGNQVYQVPTGVDALGLPGNGSFMILTFIGTGLDIVRYDTVSGGSDTYSLIVDGVSQGNFATTGSTTQRIVKVCSGLPYGTHTVKITRVSAATYAMAIREFIVYQPKKPSLPSGAIELADYNVIANYDSSAVTDTSTTGYNNSPQGTIWKSNDREFTFVGANWAISASGNTLSGFSTSCGANDNQTATYTFFGTGAMLVGDCSGGVATPYLIKVDGVANSTGVGKGNMTNSGSGVYTTAATTSGSVWRVEFTGLTLGTHTISIQRNGSGSVGFEGAFVITPIHSYKSNLYSDLQNTLSIGSNAISDNRKITPVKDAVPSSKTTAQAYGVTSSPTLSSGVTAPVPDLSLTVSSKGSWFDMQAELSALGASTTTVRLQIYVDGQPVGNENASSATSSTYAEIVVGHMMYLSSGFHKVDCYWTSDNATVTAVNTRRRLKVKEL